MTAPNFEIVAPSAFYTCGGRWSGAGAGYGEIASRRPQRSAGYIALVPISRYLEAPGPNLPRTAAPERAEPPKDLVSRESLDDKSAVSLAPSQSETSAPPGGGPPIHGIPGTLSQSKLPGASRPPTDATRQDDYEPKTNAN